ncbi:MAG TPA: hypothetical protein VF742_09950 [Terracidiphilus sp.]
MLQKSQQQSLWLSVVVRFAINILNFYDRHVPGALVEPMRKEFHLNNSQIGLLGSAFIWIYAIFGVPLGLCLAKIKSACEINNIQRHRVACYMEENRLVRSFGKGHAYRNVYFG